MCNIYFLFQHETLRALFQAAFQAGRGRGRVRGRGRGRARARGRGRGRGRGESRGRGGEGGIQIYYNYPNV